MAILGERIKSRREQLGITQQELAEAVGYKHKSSINKLESGQTVGSTKRLEAFARELKTSRSYLTGEIDDPDLQIREIADQSGNFVRTHTVDEYLEHQQRLLKRIGAYADLLERLRALPKDDQKKAARLIDGVLRTFEE